MPRTNEAWKATTNNGSYLLARLTNSVKGVLLDSTTRMNSFVILEDTYKPLSQSVWDANFGGNDFAALAKNTLYTENPDLDIIGNGLPTMADAIAAKDFNESKYLFALFAAEQDFEVAKGMALAYEDVTVKKGYEYSYLLQINSSNLEFDGIIIGARASLDIATSYIAPSGLFIESRDSAIILGWDMQATSDVYTTYDIERSTDGVSFTKVNDKPFLFGSESEDDPKEAFFKDYLPDNNTTFYYRIKGRTPFGSNGPASEIVSGKGRPNKIFGFGVSFSNINATGDYVALDWDIDAKHADKITQFNVYRAQKSRGNMELLTTTALSSEVRSFVDNEPLSSGYYQLEAIDVNDHVYHSQASFVQLEDSIPPAMPVGLEGAFPTSKTLQLTWTENTESDVSGYRVFVANTRDGEFMQVTSSPVTEAQFVYDIDPQFMVDSIFIQVLAADFRDNFSDYSEILALARPDVVAPSDPLLHHVVPSPSGIELGYKFSESKDVVRHEFQRKPAEGGSWETIQNISVDQSKQFNDDNNEQYLDEDPLQRRVYMYRLLAIDASGNLASSKVMSVRPFDNGLRGEITDFQANVQYTLLDVETIQNAEAYKIMLDLMDYYDQYGAIQMDELKMLVMLNVVTKQEFEFLLSSKPYEINSFLEDRFREIWGGDLKPEIELSWSYDSEHDQLVDYQIFRSGKGSALALCKTIPVEELNGNFWVDDDTKAGRRYVYQIMARHLGGGFSERSKVVMVKLPK